MQANERYRVSAWPASFCRTCHRLRLGDARDLSWIPDESVHLVVTSPPYWTLKEYRRTPEGLVDEGKCKAIGLSDVSLDQAKEIFEAGRIKPAVVHVESHPYFPQWDLLDYCRKNGIVLQAFAALGHSSEPKLLEDPVITAIAKRVNKTPGQALLAWAIQRGTALLTTSKTPSRIKENFGVSALPEEGRDLTVPALRRPWPGTARLSERDRLETLIKYREVLCPAS
ncbi:MAG TPA: aldo/keto reductase [Gemmataceae bacterium]|nr:aldo/keto reductase [Gemmataceae bacterium]